MNSENFQKHISKISILNFWPSLNTLFLRVQKFALSRHFNSEANKGKRQIKIRLVMLFSHSKNKNLEK